MNASQLLLAMSACRKGGRVAVVGDDRQAIYGFRGADSGSIDRLKSELAAAELPLSITYRCPRAVVALAAKMVPDYQAAPTAPEGEVSVILESRLAEAATPGDFVLSRKNAPLAGICLRLLREGKRAKVQGKEIGKGLVALLKKLRPKSMPHLMERLGKWEEKEEKRLKATGKKSAEARIQYVHDQADTIRALAEGLSGVKELSARIEDLFADMNGPDSGFIVCSSVHRAKGLEAPRVFILEDTLIRAGPGGLPRALEEANIEYVAVTRAQRELVWVRQALPPASTPPV